MNYNNYAAITICGLASADGFQPDTDRNQLWLVLEKWLEISKYDCVLSASKTVLSTGNDNGDDFARIEFWRCCVESPALALEAICKAHQEANP